MECVSYQAANEFISAWKRWETVTLRHSTAADVALKNGKPYYMSGLVLKKETDEYVRTKIALAEELGVNHVHLSSALLELRRDGVDHEKAVQLVIEYATCPLCQRSETHGAI